MQRWTRRALSGAAVVAVAGALLTVGAAGEPPADTVSAQAPEMTEIARMQADLDRVPGNARGWAELGAAYLSESRTTADPSFYAKAEAAYVRALALRPADDVALAGAGALAAARHDFAAALTLADRALTENPYSATAAAVRVDALTELGRYDEALSALRELADVRPGVDVSTRASYAFELRGDVTRARDALLEAVELATLPADAAFAHHYLGRLAFAEGDLAAARRSYDDALTADPRHLPSLVGRAEVLAASGDVPAALAELRDAVEQRPAPEALIAYGELLEATGQREQAAEQYAVLRATQQLFAANGQDVDTELALFEADHGTPEAAVTFAEKAYAARPRSVVTQDAYAWALHRAGRSAEALPVARDALRLGWRNPAMLARVGTIEAAAGDRATARRLLQQALDLNPAFSALHAPRAASLLASLR